MESVKGLKELKTRIGKRMCAEEYCEWQQFLDQVIREIEVKNMMMEHVKESE